MTTGPKISKNFAKLSVEPELSYPDELALMTFFFGRRRSVRQDLQYRSCPARHPSSMVMQRTGMGGYVDARIVRDPLAKR